MVDGGPIDALNSDPLAELTMYILHKTRERSGGYAARSCVSLKVLQT